MRKTGKTQKGIKTKELRKLLNDNDRILVDVNNDWIIFKTKKTHPDKNKRDEGKIEMVQVQHVNNPDKWEEFIDVNEAVKFFMKKVLAAKAFRKMRKMEDVEPEITVDTENPNPIH